MTPKGAWRSEEKLFKKLHPTFFIYCPIFTFLDRCASLANFRIKIFHPPQYFFNLSNIQIPDMDFGYNNLLKMEK